MIDLLFWFLVSQTVPGLPAMTPGTEVRIVSRDLLTVYASARVQDGRLAFQGNLVAGREVRVLIFPPDATEAERAEALSGASALPARISDAGDDILLQFAELDGPVSFRLWLQDERGIDLALPRP